MSGCACCGGPTGAQSHDVCTPCAWDLGFMTATVVPAGVPSYAALPEGAFDPTADRPWAEHVAEALAVLMPLRCSTGQTWCATRSEVVGRLHGALLTATALLEVEQEDLAAPPSDTSTHSTAGRN